jgi:hypothetical protein
MLFLNMVCLTVASAEAAFLGHAEEVVVERICDDELILIKGQGFEKCLHVEVRRLN